MYKLITIDFNGYETNCITSNSKDALKPIYESYIKRCVYGFPDIQEIKIIKNDLETISNFVNWRR